MNIHKRYIILALCALSVMISYADRTNISIAEMDMKKELHLSDTTLGIINSSFFWGYALTQIIGGWVADKYGGKLVLLTAVGGWSFFTFIVPFSVERGLAVFIVTRMLLGAAEGVGFPAVHSMLGKWIPSNERSRSVSLVTAFSYLGAIFSSIVASALLKPYGWRSIFYSFGLVGLLWCIPWIYFAENEPSERHHIAFDELDTVVISASRRRYSRVNHELSSTDSDVDDDGFISSDIVHVQEKGEVGTPWKRILCAKEVWAIIINQFAQSWGFFTILFYLPSYFEVVHGLKSDQAGFMTIIPNLIQVGIFLLYLGNWRNINGVFRGFFNREKGILCISCSTVCTAGWHVGPCNIFCVIRIYWAQRSDFGRDFEYDGNGPKLCYIDWRKLFSIRHCSKVFRNCFCHW